MTEKPQTNADTQRIISALVGMQRAYPLERRIRNEACDDMRETYLAVLLRWLQTGTAPSTDGFDRDALDELTALDAIFPRRGRLTRIALAFAPGQQMLR